MRIKFYLKRPGSKNPTTLYALINYNGNSIKIYTSECIHPKNWNPVLNAARSTAGFPEHPEFNERLNQFRSTVNRLFLDYKNQHNHLEPTPAVLKNLIQGALQKIKSKPNFLSCFHSFIHNTINGERINPRTKKAIGSAVAKGYQTTYNHLVNFNKKWNRELNFDTIDLDFHQQFTRYLSSTPLRLSANTIGSHFQRIKAVLAEATEKGINSNLIFKSKYFIKQVENADTIYLTKQELSEIIDLKLDGNERLANVRDLFLIGCFTGLRFSDFSILQPKNISEGFIRITQIKTGTPVIIPIHPVVAEILRKYNGGLPRTISNVKLNAYLKDLCKLIPSLNRQESKTITQGGVKNTTIYNKWQLITSHTARRSFATNEYLDGTPTLTIMAITGHKTEKSFLKYIRVTPQEHAEKIKLLWQTRTNGNLKS